jgi:multiple sugar transport system permease protein
MVGKKSKVIKRIKLIVLLAVALFITAPLILLFVSSLKDDRYQIIADMGSFQAFFVSNPSLNNFSEILIKNATFMRFFFNSVLIMASTIVGTLLISSAAAFVILRGQFKFKNALLTGIIILYIIPQESIMLPMLFEASKLNLLDTYIIQILPFVASPLYIFLFYQFFKEIPLSIGEAAKMEGISFFQLFTKIYVPLCIPAFVTVAILQGMEAWNQYLWPLLVTQTEKVRPLTVTIASYFSTSDVYWDQLFAASVIMMLPLLLVYLFFQQYFIASVSSSAVKE